MFIGLDGPGQNAREKREVQRHIQRILLCRISAPVEVDQISESRESKEGNPERKGASRPREIPGHEPVERGKKKVCVFKDPQHSQIEDNRQREDAPGPVFSQEQPQCIIRSGHTNEQQDMSRVSPGIKKETQDQKKNIGYSGSADERGENDRCRQKRPHE